MAKRDRVFKKSDFNTDFKHAPRDGTPVLILYYPELFDSRKGRWVPTGWVICMARWMQSGEEFHWEEWCGDARTRSTNTIPSPVGWAAIE